MSSIDRWMLGCVFELWHHLFRLIWFGNKHSVSYWHVLCLPEEDAQDCRWAILKGSHEPL